MKALDVNVVLVRLDKIEDYISRLDKYQNLTLEEYLNSQDIQMITERIIQIITEAALDINKYILSCNIYSQEEINSYRQYGHWIG